MKALLTLTCFSLLAVADIGRAAEFPQPLPPEAVRPPATLPEVYPSTWIFTSLSGGLDDAGMAVIDLDSPTRNLKGEISLGYMPAFKPSTVRPEIYAVETIWSRRNRGTRTDYLTVYDKRTLAPVAEVVLPGNKRGLLGGQTGNFQLTNDQTFGLVFNFTPATSIYVVDLVARKFLGEINLPGCSLAYPTGPRGFSTLCSGGTMLSFELDKKGAVAAQKETAKFNDVDDDAMYTIPAVRNGISYFPTRLGRVQPVDLSGPFAQVLPAWPLVTPDEAALGWRPSGGQLAAIGDDGRLYVIMRPNSVEGSHKMGGPEVWVFDTAQHRRTARIVLKNNARSIQITHGPDAVLVAAASGGALDLYDPKTGTFLRTLGGNIARGANLLLTAQ